MADEIQAIVLRFSLFFCLHAGKKKLEKYVKNVFEFLGCFSISVMYFDFETKRKPSKK